MDEISQGPRRDFHLPSGPWLAGAAVAVLIAAITALILTGGGRHAVSSPGSPTALAAPGPAPTAVPGTVLLSCDSANWASWGRIGVRGACGLARCGSSTAASSAMCTMAAGEAPTGPYAGPANSNSS